MKDEDKQHMKAEAVLAKLMTEHPGTGIGVLFAVRDGKATRFEIESLSHPSLALAEQNGKLSEFGQVVSKLAEQKVANAFAAAINFESPEQKALRTRNVDQDLTRQEKSEHEKYKHALRPIQENAKEILAISTKAMDLQPKQDRNHLPVTPRKSRQKPGPNIG